MHGHPWRRIIGPMPELFIQYEGFRTQPASPALGAEILGLDLNEPMPGSVKESLRKAFVNHLLLFLRDQRLIPQDQCRFAEVFGELTEYPFLRPLPDHPFVTPVIKEPWDTGVFGGSWHTDTPYLARPSKATLLYALETPTDGGDTLFANTHLAYEALPTALKQRIASLEGLFTSAKVHSEQGDYASSAGRREDRVEAPDLLAKEVRHPLVRRHPESGALSLYVSPAHTSGIVGLSRAESESLIRQLSEHIIEPRFTYRFKWQPGTLAIWDNRCLLHCPLDDYAGQRRVMHRVSIKG